MNAERIAISLGMICAQCQMANNVTMTVELYGINTIYPPGESTIYGWQINDLDTLTWANATHPKVLCGNEEARTYRLIDTIAQNDLA